MSRPALRYHGAKWRLAPWVIGHMPPHKVYVEPYGGAAGVLLRKPRSYSEVYNDLDGDIVTLFRVLRDPMQREALIEALTLTPYAREEFELAYEPADDPVERARRLYVRAEMGFGSAGATMGQTGFRVDTARQYGTAMHLWAQFPNSLAAIGQRFAGVLIEQRPALEVMQQHDGPDTLHYVDPPYVHSTRVLGAAGRRYYRHEMSDEDHAELLRVLMGLRGMVMLSGYGSALYRDALAHWHCERTMARMSAGSGTGLREECLWLNPACAAAVESAGFGLFEEATR